MAEDKTIIQNEVNFTSKGIENVTKKVEILETNLGKVAKQAEAIVTQFEKLGKLNINVNSINPNQSQYKIGRNNFVLRGSKEDKEAKTILNKQLDKANEAELQATIAHTNALNADTENIKKQTEQADDVLEVRQRNSQTNKRNAENRSRYLDKNMNWYKYRDEHPEMFVSRASQPKYQWGAALSEVGHTVSGLGGAGGRISGDLMSIAGMALKNGPLALATQGISKLVQGLADLSKASLQAYSEIETLKTGLSIISPTQVQADTLFRDVAGYATRSPYGVAQSTELVTLLKQSGVSDSELMSTLTMLGDTAGGNMEKLKRIANNYAQIVSIGKASMLDMRQFAYAGIPIFEAVSKELGVTQQALREMISDGKVTSDVIEKVFKDLTSSNGMFANATAIGAKTFAARKQNLADTKQLALSAMGERFINLGTGWDKNLQNEGLGREFLSFSENIYQGLQRWADGKNIENSVKNIENRESRIRELQQLIEYNKAQGNDAIVRDLEKQLASVVNLRNIEKDRASYKTAYDMAVERLNSVKETYNNGIDFSSLPLEYINNQRAKYQRKFNSLNYLLNPDSVEYRQGAYLRGEGSGNPLTQEFAYEIGKDKLAGISFEEQKARTLEMLKFWEDAYYAMKEFNKITAKWVQADIETRALQEQQRVSDLVDKSSKNPNSIANIASQITQEYQKTEEYQQKQLEQQKKQWGDAKRILSDIKKLQEKNGTVDFTKLGLKNAVDYFKQGAFSVEKDLSIVDGKNAEQDRGTLTTQFGSAIDQIQSYMQESGLYNYEFAKLLSYVEGDITKDKTTTQWFKDFSSHFTGLTDTVNKWIEKESDVNKKGQIEAIKDFLPMATLLLSSKTEAADLDPNSLLSGSGKEFIPLWKRLLAGATGLSANVISGTNSALEMYRDDLAIRNTTSGVLRAGLQSGLGVDFVQSLLKTSGSALELRGDKGGTYQIDWQATGKAVKDFAMQLSASTKVISAYRSGLEAQLNTYETLLSEVLTSAESQDIKSGKKFATSVQLSQMAKDYGDQLVNAFGEMLTTKDGLQVTVKDGEFYDVNGNKIAQENVIITGNIYKFMEDELPRIRAEIAKAKIQETKNQALNKLTELSKGNTIYSAVVEEAIRNSYYRKELFSDSTFDDVLKYLPDTIQKLVEEEMDKKRKDQNEEGKYKFGQKLADAQDLSEVFTLINSNDKNALELLTASVSQALNALVELLKTEEFKNSLKVAKTTEKDLNVANVRKYLTSPEEKSNLTWKDRLTGTALSTLGFDSSITLDEITLGENITKQAAASKLAIDAMNKSLKETGDLMSDLVKDIAKESFLAPFEKWGEMIIDSSASMSDLRDTYKKLGADLLSGIGGLITDTGLRIAQAGAIKAAANPYDVSAWGMIAGGLALAGTGGLMSGLGSAINNQQNQSNDKNEIDRLEAIKDDLSKILEQARKDAAYYENNMRHKNALGMNEKFTYRSVNDAIITPSGNVVTTHPEDYLIATKNPQNLTGGSSQPIINNIVNNNAGVQVKQEQKVNADGSIDIITTLEAVVGDYISSSKSDDAFRAREFRLNGHRAVM